MRPKDKIVFFCNGFIYFALIAIPFVASFSSALVNIFIGFMISAYFTKKVLERDFLPPRTVVNMPFLFLIFFSFISFINSVSLSASMGGIGKLVKYGFLLIIFADELKDSRHLKRIITAIISGLYLASLDAIHQLYFGYDFFRHKPYDFAIGLPRLKAAFPHTNIFAVFLALLLPICASLALYYLKGKRKLLLSLLAALAAYCLFFTFSRGAIVGFLAAVLFMGVLKRDKLIFLLLIITLVVGPFIIPKSIHHWVKSRDSLWEVLLDKERINIYKTSLNMIKAHPFIGVGVNTYCLNYQKYKIKETSGFTGNAQYYAHNIYLHMAGEIGLLGLAVFLWLLFVLFKKWFLFYKRKDITDFLKISSLGIVAGIIAFLINGLTETNLYYSKVATLFWFQVSLLLGIFNLKKERANGEKG